MRVPRLRVPPFVAIVVVLVAAAVPFACHEATPKATPDPTPTSTTTSSPAPSPSPAPSTDAICESFVSCGVWGECTFFEQLPITGDVTTPPLPRWKATSGAWKGKDFYRFHNCHPSDAGPAGCALYCAGPLPTGATTGGSTAGCVDGLVSESDVCTATAPPHPSGVRCEVRDGACVRAK
jgi:hypothetical protein